MMQEKGRSFSHNEPPFGAGVGRLALTHWSDMKKGKRTPNSLLPCQMLALGPTLRQDGLYHSHAAAARIMRNDTIALWKDEGRRLPGFRYKLAELRPVVNREKFQRHPWMKELSQNAVKGGAIDAEDAITRYYTGQNRRPKFHGKSARKKFRADNGIGTVRIEDNRLVLPEKMGGPVKLLEPLRWPGKVIRECRISLRGGRWYASVRVEITREEYGKTHGEGRCGIDLGLSTFATIAWPDGSREKVDAPQPHRAAMKGLRRSNRKLARRKKGGKNWHKAKNELQRRHGRMTDIRKDFLHKLSDRVTANCRTLTVESLALKGWQRRWGRKASDLAPGEFLRQLGYKAEWRGNLQVKAEWSYPSSQICHDCGERYGKLALDIREWVCLACGVKHDRDGNAAANLRDYGPELPGDCPRSQCKTPHGGAVGAEVGTTADYSALAEIRPDCG